MALSASTCHERILRCRGKSLLELPGVKGISLEHSLRLYRQQSRTEGVVQAEVQQLIKGLRKEAARHPVKCWLKVPDIKDLSDAATLDTGRGITPGLVDVLSRGNHRPKLSSQVL